MVQDLRGKWVLLTGAAGGIGREVCLLLANEGCSMVIADIDADALFAFERELIALGAKTLAKVMDVTDKGQVQALADEVEARIGTVDILINNAGIGYNNDLRHTTGEDWQRLMNINFFGVLNVTYAFLPGMIKKGGGQIVNISTGQVFFPVPTWGAYAASKAALATFSEALTWELALFKIRVTTVYPGLISTPFYKDVHASTMPQRLVLWYINTLGSSPQVMALKIVSGIKKRKRRVIQSALNWFTYLGKRSAPMGFDIGGDLFAQALCDRRKSER